MSKEENKVNRRDFLFTASYTIGAVGIGAVVWPLVHQMMRKHGKVPKTDSDGRALGFLPSGSRR